MNVDTQEAGTSWPVYCALIADGCGCGENTPLPPGPKSYRHKRRGTRHRRARLHA